uniref:Uncharacterized protein n=1 Tax=Oryza punctata TaxID=4537 RepID=A0A0E0M081_ORYPU
MEGGDSGFFRFSTAAPVPAPAHQARRALSDLQTILGLGAAPPQRLPQTSNGQRRVTPLASLQQQQHVNGGTAVPMASLPVNQVRANGLVVSTFLLTTVRRQQGLLYRNTSVHPMVAPTPVTTQMPTVQNTIPATVALVADQRIINHGTVHFMGATLATQGLWDVVSPVATHGNGNPLACICCARVFSLRLWEIQRLLSSLGFSYSEPIGPPPLRLPLPPVGYASLTMVVCSSPHHFVLTMLHMPRQAIADLTWSSQIGNIQIGVPSPASGQHVGMALSSASITGTTVLPTLSVMQMPIIHREQHIVFPIMSSSSTSLVDITSSTMPSMLNMMPMQPIHREQRAQPPTTLSSSASGLLCEYVMPEHEDMVCLTLGRSCTMNLDLSL